MNKYPPRAPGAYDADQASLESGLACPEEESVTQQQFKDECDINTIVRRFGVTGELPVAERQPISGDFTGISDYQTALNAVMKAQAGFYDLPAATRAHFNNDPGAMLDFLEDPANRDQAEKLGLVNPKTQPAAAAASTEEQPK